MGLVLFKFLSTLVDLANEAIVTLPPRVFQQTLNSLTVGNAPATVQKLNDHLLGSLDAQVDLNTCIQVVREFSQGPVYTWSRINTFNIDGWIGDNDNQT